MKRKITACILAAAMCTAMLPVGALAAADYVSVGASVDVRFWNAKGESLGADTATVKNLTDNNEYSAFRSTLGTQKAEYMMDLYGMKWVNSVYISEMNSTIQDYALWASADKTSWTRLYSGRGIGGYGKTLHFPALRTRFIKLEIISTDNTYQDAVITLKEWQAYQTDTLYLDDLSNSIYLGEKKQKLMSRDNMRRHYNEEDDAALAKQLEQGRSILNNGAATQTDIDQARDSINALLAELEDKAVPTEADFEEIRLAYFEQFTGNSADPESESRKQTLERAANNAEEQWTSMIRRANSPELWAEFIPPRANTQQEQGKINESFTKLKTMAIAYKQIGGRYYQDEKLLKDILYGINFLLDKKYDPSIAQYGNWYGWVVSTPAAMTDIMCLLKDELGPELIDRMVECMEYRMGTTSHYTRTGANRMYTAAIAFKIAAVACSEEHMHRVLYSLAEESAYKDKQIQEDSDGYYWDGSYMFHNGFMYNATYGRDQLSNTMNFVTKLSGTIWQVDQYLLDDLAKRIVDGYEAIIYNGNTVDVTAGRGLGSGNSYGKNIASSISEMADYVDDPYQSMFKSIAKEHKLNQAVNDKVTKDDTIIPRGDITRLKRYPIGNKLVLHRPEFGFGLSMFSDRTRTFEAPNGDAMQAWYASSGMTYLLDDDTAHYDRDYWVAVDHYRLPGTTVDRVQRSLTRFEGEMFGAYAWSGMMDYNEKYGNAGMMITNWNSTLQGKKSYFIFDDEIVCLGSGITGGSQTVETTVDNRKLKADASNHLMVNGADVDATEKQTVEGAKTAYIEGNIEGSAYGYYFPEGEDINLLKEHRSERETDMWSSDSTAVVDADFATLWIDHGKNPTDADYSYVLLPGASPEKVAAYAEKPDIEILSRDNAVHAVRDNKLGITGFNFWNTSGGSAAGVTSSGPLVMTLHEDDSQLEFSVTDPIYTQTRPVTVTFDRGVETVLSADSSIKVVATQPLTVEIDLKGINGQKISLKAAKRAVGFNPKEFAGAVVMKTGKTTALADNIITEAPAPLEKNGTVYLPAAWVSEQMGSRLCHREGEKGYMLIGDRVMRIDNGKVTLDGGAKDAALACEENGELMLALPLLQEFYGVRGCAYNGIAALGSVLEDSRAEEAVTAVANYMGWE